MGACTRAHDAHLYFCISRYIYLEGVTYVYRGGLIVFEGWGGACAHAHATGACWWWCSRAVRVGRPSRPSESAVRVGHPSRPAAQFRNRAGRRGRIGRRVERRRPGPRARVSESCGGRIDGGSDDADAATYKPRECLMKALRRTHPRARARARAPHILHTPHTPHPPHTLTLRPRTPTRTCTLVRTSRHARALDRTHARARARARTHECKHKHRHTHSPAHTHRPLSTRSSPT